MLDRTKRQILEDSKYRYHFNRMIYFNLRDKKIFSMEAIEDHSIEWLREKIAEQRRGNEWIFYFNQTLSPTAKQEILAEFYE